MMEDSEGDDEGLACVALPKPIAPTPIATPIAPTPIAQAAHAPKSGFEEKPQLVQPPLSMGGPKSQRPSTEKIMRMTGPPQKSPKSPTTKTAATCKTSPNKADKADAPYQKAQAPIEPTTDEKAGKAAKAAATLAAREIQVAEIKRNLNFTHIHEEKYLDNGEDCHRQAAKAGFYGIHLDRSQEAGENAARALDLFRIARDNLDNTDGSMEVKKAAYANAAIAVNMNNAIASSLVDSHFKESFDRETAYRAYQTKLQQDRAIEYREERLRVTWRQTQKSADKGNAVVTDTTGKRATPSSPDPPLDTSNITKKAKPSSQYLSLTPSSYTARESIDHRVNINLPDRGHSRITAVVNGLTTIGRMKRWIQRRTGINTKDQRLLLGGSTDLEDGDTLHSRKASPSATIALVGRLLGGTLEPETYEAEANNSSFLLMHPRSFLDATLLDLERTDEGPNRIPRNVAEAIFMPLFSLARSAENILVEHSALSLTTLARADSILSELQGWDTSPCTAVKLVVRIEALLTRSNDNTPKIVLTADDFDLYEGRANPAKERHRITWGHLANHHKGLDAAAWIVMTAGARGTRSNTANPTAMRTAIDTFAYLSRTKGETPTVIGATLTAASPPAVFRRHYQADTELTIRSAFNLTLAKKSHQQQAFDEELIHAIQHFQHLRDLVGGATGPSLSALVHTLGRHVLGIERITSAVELTAVDMTLQQRIPRITATRPLSSKSPAENIVAIIDLEEQIKNQLAAAPTSSRAQSGDQGGSTETAGYELRANQKDLAQAIAKPDFCEIARKILEADAQHKEDSENSSAEKRRSGTLDVILKCPVHPVCLQIMSTDTITNHSNPAMHIIAKERNGFLAHISLALLGISRGDKARSFHLTFRLPIATATIIRKGKFSKLDLFNDIAVPCSKHVGRSNPQGSSLLEALVNPAGFRALKLYAIRLFAALGYDEDHPTLSLTNVFAHAEELMDSCPPRFNVTEHIREGLVRLLEELETRTNTARNTSPLEASELQTVATNESIIWQIMDSSRATIEQVTEWNRTVNFDPHVVFMQTPHSQKNATVPPVTPPPTKKRDGTPNPERKAKKPKEDRHDDHSPKTEVAFAETNENTVRIHKVVYSVDMAASKTNKQKGDICWAVGMSNKSDAEARANCTKQGCNDPPGQGRHERIFAKLNIDPKTCIHKAQTKEFQQRFIKERLRFGQNPFGRG
jgi:hypothetical protein